jgi:non-specific serine/threonine protein kinase
VLAATAYRQVGETASARARLGEGLEVAVEVRESSALAAGLEQAAALAAQDGRHDVALRLYGSAAAWRASSGYVFDRDDSALALSGDAVPEDQRAALIEDGGQSSLEDAAAYALESLGSSPHEEPAAVTTPPGEADRGSDTQPEEGSFRLEGEYWTVGYGGHVLRLRDSKGLGILARLLSAPGRPYPAVDLERLGQPHDKATVRALAAQNAGDLFDDEARRAYRARVVDLRDHIEEAEARGDADRAGTLREEKDFIARELARGIGFGGQARRAGSIAERARLNVTRAVRASIRRIAVADPGLAAHLNVAVRTGTVCVYSPDPCSPVAWQVSSPAVHSH